MFMRETLLSAGWHGAQCFLRKTQHLQYNLETADKILISPIESSTFLKSASVVINERSSFIKDLLLKLL